ncbi:MAG: BON domain-containing protein [Flavisolibacter sp.]|nr:BON domain-containing protein [Flavisolibacter sp.]
MAQDNRYSKNQRQPYDQGWDRDRNRYGNDYDDYSQGGSGNVNYNRDRDFNRDRDYNRGGDRSYGNQYNNPYGGYNNPSYGGNYENRQQSNNPYDNSSYGSGYNQGRRDYDDYGNRYGNQSYGGSSWQQNRGYNQDQYRNDANSDYQNRPYNTGNYNEKDWRNDNRRRTGNRDWWERTSDEVASWFGDEDAERRRRMDKANSPHRGKGPRGYKRSDERILEDINDRLSDDPYVDASEIDVKVTNGDVVLSGTIDSKEAKRRAEDIAEAVSGVNNVENHLRVSRTVATVGSTNIRTDETRDTDTNTDSDRKKSSWL